MRKVISGAIAFAASAATFQATAFAGGYGCTTCYGPPSPPPCSTPCDSCYAQQAPATPVQHVHYHQKHGLFGHCHHAPMMMPMSAPVIQVPMAAAPVAYQAPLAYSAPAFAVPPVLAAPAYALAAAPAPQFALAAAPAPQYALAAAPSRPAALQAAPAPMASPMLDAQVAQMRAQADRAQAAASAVQASNADVQSQLDSLRQDVDALDAKFERLKACIAQCIENNG